MYNKDIWGTDPEGGPNNTKSAFLTHRTTHLVKIFVREPPENGAYGPVLENFRDFGQIFEILKIF